MILDLFRNQGIESPTKNRQSRIVKGRSPSTRRDVIFHGQRDVLNVAQVKFLPADSAPGGHAEDLLRNELERPVVFRGDGAFIEQPPGQFIADGQGRRACAVGLLTVRVEDTVRRGAESSQGKRCCAVEVPLGAIGPEIQLSYGCEVHRVVSRLQLEARGVAVGRQVTDPP